MRFRRRSGILLHPTSLPGGHGIGDFGQQAYRFVDFLAEAGHKLWQVLPLNPTGYGDSPFQCFSSIAGNPLLISLDELADRGFLARGELHDACTFPSEQVDFGAAVRFKIAQLRKSAETFFDDNLADRSEFDHFCQGNAGWLDDFALFMALKDAHGGVTWTKWPPEVSRREPGALKTETARLAHEIAIIKFLQFAFFQQWQQLRAYAQAHGVQIIGDIPIYVAHDSADVWANRQFFALDEQGNPTKVAGVPPDYFSATGQLWGNPLYDWEVLESTGYRWWVERFRAALRLYDHVRIDHFRGFEAYWEVAASDQTAEHGRWQKGPGARLFSAIEAELGDLPIIAENLGVITPEVEQMRRQFGFPGMAILQFAFGNDPQGPSFRPHNYERNLVAYTGTHDNDTVVGWWNNQGGGDSIRTREDVVKEHAFARQYLGFTDQPINWVLIRSVLASLADTAVIPLQDVLGLGSEARMNLPGTASGNWRWRARPDALTGDLAERLRLLNQSYDR
ncbi:MAG: 4-alpha-glucanotransferase [Acidobacteria bacterium]|nr:4-alpha-glucanotransferase [Acidobacteriota bacterium]